MTGPAIMELDPVQAYLHTKQQASDPVEAYLRSKRPAHDALTAPADATRALSQSRDDASGDFEATVPAVLGTLASPIRHIPGAEALASGVRAVVRGQPYRQARNDIRDAVDEAPKALTVPLGMAGAGLSAAVLPGGAMRQGFLYGAADAMGQSNPDTDLKSRVDQAGIEGTAGAAAGGLFGAARALKNAPAGSIKKVAGAAMPDFIRRPLRVVRSYRDATAPLAEAAAESSVPPAEGFVGNGMDNVLEAVKANREPVSEAGRSIPDVVRATQRYRTESGALQPRGTNARFDHFAEQMAKRKMAGEAGAEAMPDEGLEDLLRRSLLHVQKGGALNNVEASPFAGRPVRIP